MPNVDLPTPDSLVESLLASLFGRASIVVSVFLLLNFLWSWGSLARSTLSLGALITAEIPQEAQLDTDPPKENSLKIGACARLAVGWALLYVPASLITQLFAGGALSPGMGGGLEELLWWSLLCGGMAMAACYIICPSAPPRFGDRRWAPLAGLFIGYSIGATWMLVLLFTQPPPESGDWWIAPGMSLIGVIGSTFRMRIKSIQSWR